MDNLKLNLNIYCIDNGEEFYILAEDKQQAINYFENSGECIDDEMIKDMLEDNETTDIKECYSVEEILSSTKEELNIEEDEELFNMINKGNNKKIKTINIYTYAKYIVLEKEIKGEELKLPMLIGGSIFS